MKLGVTKLGVTKLGVRSKETGDNYLLFRTASTFSVICLVRQYTMVGPSKLYPVLSMKHETRRCDECSNRGPDEASLPGHTPNKARH